MKKLKLNCFIATAFDKSDVDNIYKNVIVPVLKKYSIKSLRVDKIEHNDDIDDKIFALLNESDFCLADLTYARPSVYYEAGYAFGSSRSVIYTARKDHFKPKINDPDGLLRIHFDLQMKNIIPWSLDDKTFKKKLDNRIRKVILPIIKKKNELQSVKEGEVVFGKYSLLEKTDIVIKKAKNIFKAKGYSFTKPKPGSVVSGKSFTCSKKNKKGITKIYFFVDPAVTKKDLDYFNTFYEYHFDSKEENLNNIHILFNTFRSVSKTRIMESLTKFNQVDPKTYYCQQIKYSDSKPQNIYIHFIDNIKSEIDYLMNFRSIIKNIYF